MIYAHCKNYSCAYLGFGVKDRDERQRETDTQMHVPTCSQTLHTTHNCEDVTCKCSHKQDHERLTTHITFLWCVQETCRHTTHGWSLSATLIICLTCCTASTTHKKSCVGACSHAVRVMSYERCMLREIYFLSFDVGIRRKIYSRILRDATEGCAEDAILAVE